MSLLEVHDLSFYYDDEKVLDSINFTIVPGERVILPGENGAAKATLIKNILGLLNPAPGR
ncbi:MAG: ATP-binding cassette domain-containing protein, partial [Ruoffia tabacinasalis]